MAGPRRQSEDRRLDRPAGLGLGRRAGGADHAPAGHVDPGQPAGPTSLEARARQRGLPIPPRTDRVDFPYEAVDDGTRISLGGTHVVALRVVRQHHVFEQAAVGGVGLHLAPERAQDVASMTPGTLFGELPELAQGLAWKEIPAGRRARMERDFGLQLHEVDQHPDAIHVI